MFPTAAAARPSSLCFLPAPGPFPAFQFFLFRHAAPSFPSFSFPFLSRSTLFLLPLCLLFSFAPTGPSALPFRTSSDFRFRSFLSVSSLFSARSALFSAPFPARPAVLPSTIPALPVSVSRLLGLCFLSTLPLFLPRSILFLFSVLFPPAPPSLLSVVSALPASVSRPSDPCFLPPPFRPVLSPLSLFPDRFAPISSPAGGGLRARLTIGNKFPAIAFLFC